MKFTFIKEPTNDWIKDSESKVTFEFEEVQIDNVIAHFEDFLRGCGFHFEGYLEFANEPKMEMQEAMPHINNAFDDQLAQWDNPKVTAEEEAFWEGKK